ncbi:MAG: dienelactone hydrolase family protein [Actinomycetota bacterium]
MCYDPTARPPLPPISGGAGIVEARPLELEAADGNRFGAYSATTDKPGGPGIVILPDVRGLHPFYTELAERFAQAGIHGAALDYFGRTAGIGNRGDDFDWEPHRKATTPDGIAADAAAAVAHLRSPEGGGAEAVFTVGFCFGGRNSFNQAARDHGLAGVIGFYGIIAPRDPDDTNAPTQLAPGYRCPVLGLFGGADRVTSRDDIEEFRRALDGAGVANEIEVYEGAPHSFFDRTADQHREASEDAWRRMLEFIRNNAA